MKWTLLSVTTLALLLTSPQLASFADDRSEVLGVWRLVSYEVGKAFAFGARQRRRMPPMPDVVGSDNGMLSEVMPPCPRTSSRPSSK
jgi:hypothetical protein